MRWCRWLGQCYPGPPAQADTTIDRRSDVRQSAKFIFRLVQVTLVQLYRTFELMIGGVLRYEYLLEITALFSRSVYLTTLILASSSCASSRELALSYRRLERSRIDLHQRIADVDELAFLVFYFRDLSGNACCSGRRLEWYDCAERFRKHRCHRWSPSRC